jgi:hypothetical protein
MAIYANYFKVSEIGADDDLTVSSALLQSCLLRFPGTDRFTLNISHAG